MKKRISISKANITNHELLLETMEPLNGLVPGEQILVDSDQFSFIYIMEDKEDYTYIVLPDQIWTFLKRGLKNNLPVSIVNENKRIELTNFQDELTYVISNIKGNSNYGNDMVSKVEGVFIEK